MDGLNRIYLLGNLGSDPSIHQTKEGKAFTRLSLAVSRHWSFDVEGKSQRRTDWHSILVWGGHGENCAKYLKKGSPILVEGSLSTYKEATGLDEGVGSAHQRNETRVAIHADRVTFLPDGRHVKHDQESEKPQLVENGPDRKPKKDKAVGKSFSTDEILNMTFPH